MDGELRAFANSCRHRGHELLPCGQGAQERVIICPYHAWTCSLSGELRAAAGFRNRRDFDFGRWGLAPLPVTEWHGLVDWAACESVRGLASPHVSPGPLSSAEDAVYSFVTTIARGYLGQPVWSPVP